MDSDDSRSLLQWRQCSVDVLVAAATFSIVIGAVGTVADTPYLLLLPLALLSIGLMLEPRSKRGRFQPLGRFDATVVDAASM